MNYSVIIVTLIACVECAVAAPSAVIGQRHLFRKDIRRRVGEDLLFEFPWYVRLHANSSTGRAYQCGGSIISPTLILTAAHCLKITNLVKISLNSETLSITAQHFIIHPGYNSTFLFNDIALIKLDAPHPYLLKISRNNKIKLPDRSHMQNSFVNYTATAIGVHHDNSLPISQATSLHLVKATVISTEECRKMLVKTFVTEKTLCTQNEDSEGICGGDSGGPLVLRVADKWLIIGIISFGPQSSCRAGLPDGFVRLTEFVNWLHEYL